MPMMAGFIKPVILLPFSILSQLSPAQVEAVLLHELAHIRRKDYIVNLLFSLGEMFFFFNPGVLWICSLIREERENCCDDIAVRQAGSKKEFISALVSFQDHDSKAGLCALAFPGSGDHLLQRVRRIVYRDNKTLDGGEKFFLICCFFISAALMVAFTRATPRNGNSRPNLYGQQAFVHSVKRDTTGRDSLPPAAPPQIVQRKAIKKEKVKTVIRAKKDSVSNAEDRVQQQEEQEQKDMELQKTQIKQRMEIDKETIKLEQRSKEEERKAAIEQSRFAREIQKEQWKIVERQRKDQEDGSAERHDKVDEVEKSIQVEQDQIDQEEKAIARESRRIAEETRRIEEERARVAQRKMALEGQEFANADKPIAPANPVMSMIYPNKKMFAPTPPQRMMQVESNRKVLMPIIDELVAEHLIDDKEFLSFSLDDQELIVNGVKQPDELQQRFRQKFLGDPGDRIMYSRSKNGSESVTINIHPSKKMSTHNN